MSYHARLTLPDQDYPRDDVVHRQGGQTAKCQKISVRMSTHARDSRKSLYTVASVGVTPGWQSLGEKVISLIADHVPWLVGCWMSNNVSDPFI